MKTTTIITFDINFSNVDFSGFLARRSYDLQTVSPVHVFRRFCEKFVLKISDLFLILSAFLISNQFLI